MNLLWIALTSVVAAKEIIFNPDPVVALGTNSPIRFSVNLAAGVGAGNVALTSDDFDFTSCQLSFTNENAQHPQYVKAFFKSQQRKLQYEIKAYLFVPGQCKQPETLIVKLIDPNPMLCIIWADPHVQPILDKSAKLPPPVTEFVTSADAMTITPSDYWFSLAHDKPNGEKSFVVFETEKVMIQAKGRIYDDHVGTEPGGYWLTEVDACYEKTCFSYSIKAITKRIEQFHPPGGAPAGFSLKWEDRILHTPSDNYRGINAKDGADPNTPEDVLEKLDGGAFTLVFPDKTEMTVWSKINHKIIQQIEIKRPEGTGYDNVYRGICTVQRSGSSSDQKEYQAEYVSGDAEIAVAKGDYKRIDVPGYQQNCPVPSQPECETYPPPTTSKKPPPPDTQTYPHPPPATSSNPPPPDTQTYPHPPPATSSHPPPPPDTQTYPSPPKSTPGKPNSSTSRPYPPPSESTYPVPPPVTTSSDSYPPPVTTPCDENPPVTTPCEEEKPTTTPCEEETKPTETPCDEEGGSDPEKDYGAGSTSSESGASREEIAFYVTGIAALLQLAF